MTDWLVVIGIGIGTLLLRASFIVFMGERDLPELLVRGLRFVPSAVLAALVLPNVVLTESRLDLAITNDRLLPAAIAGLVAWKTRNIAYTIAAGMVSLWIAQAVL